MISAFDTENRPDGSFIFGVFKDGNNIEVFEKSKKLRMFLKTVGDYCFANNLFYDFGNLYSDRDFGNDILQINSGRTVIRQGRFISLKYQGFPTTFFDLFNYLRLSVEAIGKHVGKEKLKFDPYNLDYCVRDTEITYDAALKCVEFIAKHFDLLPRPTTASYAMAIYKKSGFDPLPELDNNDYYKPGYFGGRTEAFFIGRRKMSVYDINSAYPFAMTQDVPFGEPRNINSAAGGIRKTDFVSCTVNIPDDRYGLLPIKYGWASLCFPVGRLKGRWWGVELLEAEKYGAKIERITNIVRYRNTGAYLKPFVDMLYDMRLKNDKDPILKGFIKLILNSFYGKLATKFIVQKIVTEKNEKDIYYDDYIFKIGSAFGLAERDYGFVKSARVDIAGYITAFVRSLLLSAIMETGAFYCDTDSIFVASGTIPKRVNKSLGAFKKEYSGYITIVGSKMYCSDDNEKIACKGIPKSLQAKALRNVGREILTERPRLWLTAMINNTQPNEWKPFRKTVVPGSQNRFGDNGWTQPFLMRG